MSRPSWSKAGTYTTIQPSKILAPISHRTVKADPGMQSGRRFLARQQFSDSISASLGANYTGMSLRERTRPGLGIIEPCLPSPAKLPELLRR